jgi:hypothetical protein
VTLDTQFNAGVVELVDTTDSKSVAAMRGGSSPPTGTIIAKNHLRGVFLYLALYKSIFSY